MPLVAEAGHADTGAQAPVQTRYIARYRLEKKDPNAAISEPIEPIIYWVDPATPKQFVEYVKKGIEDWQPAFEAAGFKNGIIAKEAPANDPEGFDRAAFHRVWPDEVRAFLDRALPPPSLSTPVATA